MTATAAAGAPSPAVAPPPGNPRFALFDSLRAIAVLAVLVFHVFALTGALAGPSRRRRRRARQPGADPLLRDLGLPALPALRRRARRGPAGARGRRATRAGARCASSRPTGSRSPCSAIFPGIVGVFSGDWWRYYLFLQLYAQRHRRPRHPGRLDAVRRGGLLHRAAAVGARRARGWRRRGLAARRAGALAVVAVVGVAVQVAAARNVVSDLLATDLLGQCTWLALGMALAVASVAVARATAAPARRARRRRRARACAGWAPPRRSPALAPLLRPGGLLGIAQALAAQQPVAKTLAGIALTAVLHAPADRRRSSASARAGCRAGCWPRPARVARPRLLRHLPLAPHGRRAARRSAPNPGTSRPPGWASRSHRPFRHPVLLASPRGQLRDRRGQLRLVELPFLRRKER